MTAIAVLIAVSLGTYALRLAGPLLEQRLALSPATRDLLQHAAIVVIVALVATATLLDGAHFAGWARIFGVGCGTILLVFRAPLVVALPLGIAVTALLRWWGIA